MAPVYAQACLWAWVLTVTQSKSPDRQVTCTFSQDCVLPCSFEPTGSPVNISWHRQDSPVLFFDGSGGSAEQQSLHYVGRTSLFREHVSHGNASLQLRSVNTGDRGKYRCRVSTEQGTRDIFVIARVEAPVSSLTLEVTHRSGHKEVRCSSQDIYPAPQLRWSTEPPVRPEALKHTTRKTANEQGLYSIESTMNTVDGLSEHSYICTINSSYGSQTWRASLCEREVKTAEGQQLTIPCVVPEDLHNFTLTWSFTKEDRTALILMFNSQTRHVANNWAPRAQVDPAQVMSGDGSLCLQDLDSSAHAGTYSCAFSALRTQYLVRTRVNLTAPESGERQVMGKESRLWFISAVVAAAALCVGALVWCLRQKADSPPFATDEETTEMQPVRTENGTQSERRGLTSDP